MIYRPLRVMKQSKTETAMSERICFMNRFTFSAVSYYYTPPAWSCLHSGARGFILQRANQN